MLIRNEFGKAKVASDPCPMCRLFPNCSFKRLLLVYFDIPNQVDVCVMKKNGGIDGQKSRIRVWKLVPTCIAFLPPYSLAMGYWLMMGSTLV